jgi:hypothetical protein
MRRRVSMIGNNGEKHTLRESNSPLNPKFRELHQIESVVLYDTGMRTAAALLLALLPLVAQTQPIKRSRNGDVRQTGAPLRFLASALQNLRCPASTSEGNGRDPTTR